MEEVKAELTAAGIEIAPVELGIMVETPAAVMISEELAKGAQRGHTKVMYFADREKLTQTLINFVKAGDTVLVKASHFMEFPKIVKAMEEAFEA